MMTKAIPSMMLIKLLLKRNILRKKRSLRKARRTKNRRSLKKLKNKPKWKKIKIMMRMRMKKGTQCLMKRLKVESKITMINNKKLRLVIKKKEVN